jgi:subtilisin family serine protease
MTIGEFVPGKVKCLLYVADIAVSLRDACTFSPAASENAITVGASTIQDSKAYFSNHGPCVDIFAPGLNILSVWNSGNHSVNTISGTSYVYWVIL